MSKNAAWVKVVSAGLMILMVLTALSTGLAEQTAVPEQCEGLDVYMFNTSFDVFVDMLIFIAQQHIFDDTINYQGERDDHYIYRGEQLIMACSVQCKDAYSAILLQMTAKYGVPANIPAEEICGLFNDPIRTGASRLTVSSGREKTEIPSILYAADFSRLTAWKLDDGTIAALYVIGDKCYTTFFYAPLISGGE